MNTDALTAQDREDRAQFLDACRRQDTETVDSLLQSIAKHYSDYGYYRHATPDQVFQKARQKSDWDVVRGLWTSGLVKIEYLDDDQAFRKACLEGKLKKAQELWAIDQEFGAYLRCGELFRKACKHGALSVAQWLLSIEPLESNIVRAIRYKRLLSKVCQRGWLKVAQWLWCSGLLSDITAEYCGTFVLYLEHERRLLDAAQWFSPDVTVTDTHIECRRGFDEACLAGHFQVAQWVWSLDQGLLASNVDIKFLRRAVKNGDLASLRWLWSLNPTHSVRLMHKYVLRKACSRGHLRIVEWLLSLNIGIDVHYHNELIFRTACRYDDVEFARRLLSQYSKIKIHILNIMALHEAWKRESLSVIDFLVECTQNDPEIRYVRLQHDSDYQVYIVGECGYYTDNRHWIDGIPVYCFEMSTRRDAERALRLVRTAHRKKSARSAFPEPTH